MYEHRNERLLPRRRFAVRMASHVLLAFGLIAAALTIGVVGYMTIEGMAWDDSILNASMLLGGMGPVGELHSTASKLFASAYALFSGLMFITVTGLLMTPILHRVLHRFHMDEPDAEGRPSRRKGAAG